MLFFRLGVVFLPCCPLPVILSSSCPAVVFLSCCYVPVLLFSYLSCFCFPVPLLSSCPAVVLPSCCCLPAMMLSSCLDVIFLSCWPLLSDSCHAVVFLPCCCFFVSCFHHIPVLLSSCPAVVFQPCSRLLALLRPFSPSLVTLDQLSEMIKNMRKYK